MDDSAAKERGRTEPRNEYATAEANRAAPDKPWSVDVEVYLEDVTDPKNPKFRLETYLPIDQNDPNQVITFHNCRRPGFEIAFNLFDQTGQDYRFPPQAKRHDALWSKQGAGCPPDNYGQQWDEFTVVRVKEPDRLTLVVRNRNETETQFGYTLRVTKDDGLTYVDLDPGGGNQNGNID